MESRNSRIKKALKDHGISQEKLADRLTITRAAVSERLNKEDEIDSVVFIEAVAELTGVTKEFLLYGDGSGEMKHEDPVLEVLVRQSKTQSEYIDLLKGQIHKLEEELGKYKTKKSKK